MIDYFNLFFIIFKINAITFGGGYTIAPVLMEEFVNKRNLLSKEDMLNILALAQSSPGAMAVSVSLLIGYKVKGVRGSFVCILASILPPIIVISLIFVFYKQFANNLLVRSALRGMSGVIVAILIITTINLFKVSIEENRIISIILSIFSFMIAYFTNINIALIVLFLALFGLVFFGIRKKIDE